ncbi:hypothetical protein MHAS44199_17425 [Mycolicibacterium hassiacum DSM 44199]|jgi:hypothetical protein|nr:hypothetical protein [Mycolicibacterium hassiacum DSM 44199]PZN15556.1 MAG: hypothetical protein DIU75_20540 [Mycolicibacterium hassiacum]
MAGVLVSVNGHCGLQRPGPIDVAQQPHPLGANAQACGLFRMRNESEQMDVDAGSTRQFHRG